MKMPLNIFETSSCHANGGGRFLNIWNIFMVKNKHYLVDNYVLFLIIVQIFVVDVNIVSDIEYNK